MDYLSALKAEIHLLHDCEAVHRVSVPVMEVVQGKTVWSGEVEIFDLVGHATARRCYAWGHPNARQPTKLDVVAVLEIPPVVSAETAVRAAIASKAAPAG
jgi:hypothetical protein